MNTATVPPLTGAAFDELAETIAAGASIVGIGESTRFSREVFGTQDQLFRRLVRHHGFRALAVQDSAGVGARLDAYVNGGEGSAEDALADAWRPQRTAEMAGALEWIRAFNQDHADDPVRIFGVKPVQAGPADYDAVLDHVRLSAPERLAELAGHLEPIRTAHRLDEHVQRAQGVHPGRPFAEHARDALALVSAVPGAEGDIVARMRLIVAFHERSVAGRDNYAGDAVTWADAIDEWAGRRVVYWDGIAHTSATEVTLGMAPERGPQATVGSVLRGRHGSAYVSVAIGFHHGDLGVHAVPAPGADLVDARLPEGWSDPRRDDRDGPAKLRVISGVYDPSHDGTGFLAVDSLADAFDALVHFREASPVRWLP
ncbi:erythromycin esterase family protein [Streptomyces sp. NPDC049577]|uniref:erythromycin esterase family protein n=1 Tax=Streptomyces sp. NPDC049577 TaxID=3155153 RepID=UPI003440C0E2